MRRWIGLHGKMGAGKDHAYQTMVNMAPLRMSTTGSPELRLTRVSFADTLRGEIEETLTQGEDIDLPALWNKPYPEEIRRLLQWWGTDLRRAEDPDYWVKKTIEEAEDMLTQRMYRNAVPVFTDVRFPNEAKAIWEKGGVVIRIIASDEVRRQRLGQEPPTHESETALDGWDLDLTIVSNRDDSAYQQAVRNVLVMAGVL